MEISVDIQQQFIHSSFHRALRHEPVFTAPPHDRLMLAAEVNSQADYTWPGCGTSSEAGGDMANRIADALGGR